MLGKLGPLCCFELARAAIKSVRVYSCACVFLPLVQLLIKLTILNMITLYYMCHSTFKTYKECVERVIGTRHM